MDPADISEMKNRRALIVASTGGHLSQSVRWQEKLGLRKDSVFVTFDSPQSRSLLKDRPHVFVPYVAPRDIAGIARMSGSVSRLLRKTDVDLIFSTGAGVALACIAPSSGSGPPLYYYESISRFQGPSLTGRVLRWIPGVHRGTQHRGWASTHWPFIGSLLDEYAHMQSPPNTDQHSDRRIFVTLGTIKPYRFDRLIDQVLMLLQPGDDITWQLGSTDRDDLPGSVSQFVSAVKFQELARHAEVVISQSGVGAILDFLDMGICPIVVPRRKVFGEHVDDHQAQVANALHERDLITAIEVEDLARSDLELPRGITVLNPERKA
jgi:UDP-N-acetylglucosamine--N-acetylmuramyl-(pentapeptide) pyrophosphoryl-undecaprenol N-acetylglucosamine transferase